MNFWGNPLAEGYNKSLSTAGMKRPTQKAAHNGRQMYGVMMQIPYPAVHPAQGIAGP